MDIEFKKDSVQPWTAEPMYVFKSIQRNSSMYLMYSIKTAYFEFLEVSVCCKVLMFCNIGTLSIIHKKRKGRFT